MLCFCNGCARPSVKHPHLPFRRLIFCILFLFSNFPAYAVLNKVSSFLDSPFICAGILSLLKQNAPYVTASIFHCSLYGEHSSYPVKLFSIVYFLRSCSLYAASASVYSARVYKILHYFSYHFFHQLVAASFEQTPQLQLSSGPPFLLPVFLCV